MSSSWSSSNSSASPLSPHPPPQANFALYSVEQSQRAPSSDPRDNSAGAILTEIEPEAPPAPLSENGSSPSTGSYVHVEEDKEEEEVEEIVEVVVAEVVAEVAEVVAEVEEALEKGDDPPEPTLAA